MTQTRCPWPKEDPQYVAYHDEEWGVPQRDAGHLFEMLLLEGAQAGLSWITVLKKRERYRQVLHGFDPERLARLTDEEIEVLMQDPGIIRNRLKVDAAIHNAQAIRALRDSHGGFADWLDAHALLDGALRDKAAWVKLFKKSFRFTGGEIVGEFLMSLGYLPGAHCEDCPAHKRIAKLKPVWMRHRR